MKDFTTERTEIFWISVCSVIVVLKVLDLIRVLCLQEREQHAVERMVS